MKKSFNGFVAKVEMLKSEKATTDKNGLMPIILIGIAGEIPNKTVISGTYAANMDLEVGNVYLFQADELEEDVMYGRQFSFRAISKQLSAIETLQAAGYVGKLKVIDVENSELSSEIPDEHLELRKVL
ncbi:MAG TPA: hypothetical protein DD740_10885 [Chryseobacterium sp.]|nr:hypothetical protein [Chryseobacterium sp.]